MIPAHQNGKKILGRVFFDEKSPAEPGWVLQFFDCGRLCSVALGIDAKQAVLAAVADAADYLSCRPEHIQVGEKGLQAPVAREAENPQHKSHASTRSVAEPQARVFYADADSLDPGWHIQFHLDGKVHRQALWQSDPADVEAALTEAAWLMGCHPDEILVGGDVLDWRDDADFGS